MSLDGIQSFIYDSTNNQLLTSKGSGIIVHDHYIKYYSYGIDNAECNVHVLRYLNAVVEFTNHNWAKKLKNYYWR